MTSSLFRREAVDAQRHRLYGEVVVAQPLSFHVLTGLFLLIIIGVAVFLATGSFARKERANGFLQPDNGLVKVVAPIAGTVADIHVAEGEAVAKGGRLMTIVAERVSAEGRALDSAILESAEIQLEELNAQIALLDSREEADRARLRADLSGIDDELHEVARQLDVQHELVKVAIENLNAIEDLTKRGVVSETEYKARQERVLGYRQQLASLTQQRAALNARKRQAELALQRLPLELQERLSELASRKAELLRQRAELEGQRAITLIAPIAGTVTTLQASRGGQTANRPLLTILPEGGVLEAQLFVPTRAIGFIKTGQTVRLAYDAFNYRRFGIHEGTVKEVSATILAPDEVPGPVSPQEPVYRVVVTLARQTVDAYGEAVPLQAGMTLSADIILEDRSLIEWLLDPLYSLRGRAG